MDSAVTGSSTTPFLQHFMIYPNDLPIMTPRRLTADPQFFHGSTRAASPTEYRTLSGGHF
jgi:hypothetical protein